LSKKSTKKMFEKLKFGSTTKKWTKSERDFWCGGSGGGGQAERCGRLAGERTWWSGIVKGLVVCGVGGEAGPQSLKRIV
jgi:hypothetical protein